MDTAKLFLNGKSQAVRLPKAYRMRGKKVFVKKVANAVVLIPCDDSWQPLLESLSHFSPDYMKHREQPPEQTRGGVFE